MDGHYREILSEYGWLADLYMIDYVVERQWQKLPDSWRNYFGQLLNLIDGDRSSVRDLMKFLLCSPSEHQIDAELLKKFSSILPPLSFSSLKMNVKMLSSHSYTKVEKPSDFLKYLDKAENPVR